MPKTRISLRYTGDGSQWIEGIPAADIETDDEILAADLVASGLYERVTGARSAPVDDEEGKD